ncbi:metal-dependent hydrolase [Janthinobacterium agaricidamnosum]|uniref:Membrane-bound metal-dependent hydrolase n=1 Tax=Janthinobacterium agaricidamnosum NBRC 102515 = DSM 9628 TaxID=1349767 RepID=W0V1Q1_9BURK|nr:metal-dependent hydrolase [Janthinobacterium agaricidamnosum]CDG81530.1 conserved hypothetical protein [Janthinobacterium agaricidamnosum NBRC 102515 = DSM 9628]
MDNITHSVIGLGTGELLHRSLSRETSDTQQQTRRALMLFACWFASNAPDLDLFLTRLLPSPLGYLLHHRGHTHTVLFALPQALLLLALIWLLWPAARALLKHSRSARLGLGSSIVLGLGLHLFMDFLNSYGLHPFYPLASRWFYGDTLFIIEPLLWVAFGVPVVMALRSRVLKAAILAGLLAALCFFVFKDFLAWTACAVLLAIGIGLALLQHRAGQHGRQALALSFGIGIAFILLQGAATHVGRARLQAALQHIDPASHVWDVSMTAFPSNPLCWVFVSAESNQAAATYRLRRGMLSLAPGILPPAACPAGLADRGPGTVLAPGIVQMTESNGSLAALRQLQGESCYFDAWLRFARMPGLDGTVATDARFSGGLRGNFTSIDVARLQHRACPVHVPGWEPPRSDMLRKPQ